MDPQTRFQTLTWLIAFIGGFGMLVIVILAAMWRRHLRRDQRLEQELAERHAQSDLHIDTWQAAGERLHPIATPPNPEDEETPDDEPWHEDNRDDTWDRDPDEDDGDDPDEDDPPWG